MEVQSIVAFQKLEAAMCFTVSDVAKIAARIYVCSSSSDPVEPNAALFCLIVQRALMLMAGKSLILTIRGLHLFK